MYLVTFIFSMPIERAIIRIKLVVLPIAIVLSICNMPLEFTTSPILGYLSCGFLLANAKASDSLVIT